MTSVAQLAVGEGISPCRWRSLSAGAIIENSTRWSSPVPGHVGDQDDSRPKTVRQLCECALSGSSTAVGALFHRHFPDGSRCAWQRRWAAVTNCARLAVPVATRIRGLADSRPIPGLPRIEGMGPERSWRASPAGDRGLKEYGPATTDFTI